MKIADTHQIREADRIQIEEMQFPGIILMENAAAAAVSQLIELYDAHTSFLVLAGPGNNGGDGLAMARMLFHLEYNVSVLCSHPAERYKGDALINFQVLSHLPVPVQQWSPERFQEAIREKPVLIDALLGTGITAGLKAPISEIIASAREAEMRAVAVDLPSGLNAGSGESPNQVIPAAHTLTFQLPKVCHLVYPAAGACGTVHVLDIGIWPQVIERLGIRREAVTDEFVRKNYLDRDTDGHKGTFGHVLLVGGSRKMSGAIALAALGAKHAGAGLVTVLAPKACQAAVNAHCPEAMCTGSDAEFLSLASLEDFQEVLQGKSVVMVGPGMGREPGTEDFLKAILPLIEVPLILDADGLNILAATPSLWESLPAVTVFTPHPGEFRRLIPRQEDLPAGRLEATEYAARTRGGIWILKGAGTVIAFPDGKTYINTSGNPGMASGGTGDVLSGILASLMAQGYPPETAIPIGVYLHGKSGDVIAGESGQEGVTASELAKQVGRVWNQLVSG